MKVQVRGPIFHVKLMKEIANNFDTNFNKVIPFKVKYGMIANSTTQSVMKYRKRTSYG